MSLNDLDLAAKSGSETKLVLIYDLDAGQALIEARSCERFARLAPFLDEELEKFYVSLLKSEGRHFQDYLKLAETVASQQEISERLDVFLAIEQQLIESPDSEFRFHSGPCG